MQAAPTSAKFRFTLTSMHVPSGDTGGEQEPFLRDAVVNGIDFGRRDLPDCDEDTTCELNNYSYEVDVPFGTPSVPVRFYVREDDDASGDDSEFELILNVDNQTGLASGTARSVKPADTQPVPLGATCGSSRGWGFCWEIEHTGLPEIVPTPKVCPFWNADYVDERPEDDPIGERRVLKFPAGGTFDLGITHFPASFAAFENLVAVGPFGSITVAAGNLDAEGCIPASVFPPLTFLHLLRNRNEPQNGGLHLEVTLATTFQRPDGVRYVLRGNPVPGPATAVGSAVLERFRLTLNDSHPSDFTTKGVWSVPTALIRLQAARELRSGFHVAAAVSRLLATPDLQIAPSTYEVFFNAGVDLGDKTVPSLTPVLDSANSGDFVFFGPASPLLEDKPCSPTLPCQEDTIQECLTPQTFKPCQTGDTCLCMWPDQSRWKFVLGHELGHQLQSRATGDLKSTAYGFVCTTPSCPGVIDPNANHTQVVMVDPPFIAMNQDSFCGCQHVKAANALHCMQSIENFDRALGEGVGHFVAAKLWNNATESDCSFNYYKEIFAETAPPGVAALDRTIFGVPGKSIFPPYPVDCGTPSKWRNKNCGVDEAKTMGTERDWLGFLWALNTRGNDRTTTAELWNLYRHACDLPPPSQPAHSNPLKCTGAQGIVWMLDSNAPPTSPTPSFSCLNDANCPPHRPMPLQDKTKCVLPDPVGSPCNGQLNCICKNVCSSDADCRGDELCLLPDQTLRCHGETNCACHVPPNAKVSFQKGAEVLHGEFSLKYFNFITLASQYGVTHDLTP